jgi:hypothetical protein
MLRTRAHIGWGLARASCGRACVTLANRWLLTGQAQIMRGPHVSEVVESPLHTRLWLWLSGGELVVTRAWMMQVVGLHPSQPSGCDGAARLLLQLLEAI